MENDYLKRDNDSQDMMKNVKLQNEKLSSTFKVKFKFLFSLSRIICLFKEQIAAIEADHERSILILQNQLQTSKQEIEQLKNRIETLKQINIDNEKESPQISTNNDFNKDDFQSTVSERQQGEVINFSIT